MDTTVLVNNDIDLGYKLLDFLKEKNLEFKAALWLYYSDRERWYLLLSSPEVDDRGAREMYYKISKALLNRPDELREVESDDIKVIPYNSKLIQLFKNVVHIQDNSGVRFQNNVINGQLIEDAYIYRIE